VDPSDAHVALHAWQVVVEEHHLELDIVREPLRARGVHGDATSQS
jgi:hypothetical protein